MSDKRESGLDLLRAAAALCIVACHTFPPCAWVNREPGYPAPLPDLFLYALVLSAVNCFGLLSGYVGYREKDEGLRLSPLLMIWLQLVFWRVLLLWLPVRLGLADTPLSPADVLLPLTKRVNWYITAYCEMMLLAPFLQRAVRSAGRRENARTVLALFALCSLLPLCRAFVDGNPFLLDEGYSWMWLAVLYFWGCSLKKFGWFRETRARRLTALLLASLLLASLWRALAAAGRLPFALLNRSGRLFYVYTSPALVLASGCLLLLAARLRVPERLRGAVRTAASASLGVFLIHTTVWYWLLEPWLEGFLPALGPGSLRALLAALLIAVPCALLELLRARLFAALRVRRLTDRVQASLNAALSRLSERLLP